MCQLNSRSGLVGIWLLFAVIFSSLATYHYNATKSAVPEFVNPDRPYAPYAGVKVAGADVDRPLKDFTNAINKYTHDQNTSSQQQNWISFWGYIAAALMAIFSAIIEFIPRDNKNDIKGRDSGGNKHENQFTLIRREPKDSSQTSGPEHAANDDGPCA